MQNYYEILGVPREASEKDIRWAYRRLVFACHPDRASEGVASEEIFRLATEAYQTLSDSTRRDEYDFALFGDRVRVYRRTGTGEISIEEYYDPYPSPGHQNSPGFIFMGTQQTGGLVLATLGVAPIVLLAEVFFPGESYSISLAGVWGLALALGGVGRTLAIRFGGSRFELGIGGIILGSLAGTLLFQPTEDPLSFFALIKIAASGGFGGWLGGTLSGKTAQRASPSKLGMILVGFIIGAFLGGVFSGVLAYLLSTGAFNESLLASLGTSAPTDLEGTAACLGAIGGAVGGALLGTAVPLSTL